MFHATCRIQSQKNEKFSKLFLLNVLIAPERVDVIVLAEKERGKFAEHC
jgi:hypothetical protein